MRGGEPQTDFEKPRGVSGVEVRDGFAQAIVDGLEGDISKRRIDVLQAVSEAGVSLDFLKLAPRGLSFLIPSEDAAIVGDALEEIGVACAIHSPRSIVMVHAVNMRDEEGLIARIVSNAIGTGMTIEHLGDMHDRMLIVLQSDDAKALAGHLNVHLAGVTR